MNRGLIAAIVISAGAAIGVAVYFHTKKKVKQSKKKKNVRFADEQVQIAKAEHDAEHHPNAEHLMETRGSGKTVVVDLLGKLFHSAKEAELELNNKLGSLNTDDNDEVFNQSKAVAFIVAAMQPLNEVREELKKHYGVGEEELKQLISEHESVPEVSKLTKELADVKAAIAEKSKQSYPLDLREQMLENLNRSFVLTEV